MLLRFAEESGTDRENVKLTLPFVPVRAVRTTLHGKEKEPLKTDGTDVFFSAAGGGYTTIRVYGSFTILQEEPENDLIYDIFTVPVENSRTIICFTKAKHLEASGFRILGDGQVLAEIENSSEYIQTVEVACRPENIEIEIIA